MPLTFSDLYNFASRFSGDTTSTGISRAKDAVSEANKQLSYGIQHPALKPWWRRREDTLTPVSGTQSYVFPSSVGTLESTRSVWYRTRGTRFGIEMVDEDEWMEDAIENTSITGTPRIVNIFSDAADVYKLRFSPIPSSSFISIIDGGVIRLDFYIQETLETSSADTATPLMPNSRRMGIAWKAIEMLSALQGDFNLLEYAAAQGRRYYEMIFDDDVSRLGSRTRESKPLHPMGARTRGNVLTDYGHLR